MKKIIEFFRDKTVAFYVALAFAALSAAATIVYAVLIGGLEGYFSFVPILLIIVGIAAFAGLSVIGSCRLGSAVLSAAQFSAFIVYVGTVYEYLIVQAMSAGKASDIDGFYGIIAIGVMMFVSAAGENVVAWIKQRKIRKEKTSGDVTAGSGGKI